ncbi:MAG: HAD family hydrolase [Leptolyngbyaceae cyanobacterium bins.59]|nr:HAD family hydrolase [Leptolyngbyaceae cyanobacterium bins.59]
MSQNAPTLLALDFDGVLCDGLLEYFQVAWRAYCHFWKPDSDVPPAGLAEQFYPLRPVVETGWEMPVLLRALLTEVSEEKILANWQPIAQQILIDHNLDRTTIGATLDGLRDEWIATDLKSWLALHRFYPGVADRLRDLLNSPTQVFIITTKEGRFVEQLLQLEDLTLPRSQIFGKETQRPKADILRELQQLQPEATIWFVEDRLKTLEAIEKFPDLAPIQLFLADWGYNTETERQVGDRSERIHLISLSHFAGEFPAWIPQ